MQTSLLLEMAAEADPDRPILGPAAAPLTNGELLTRARAAAALLAGRSGDKVAFVGLNSPEMVVALFASALAGKAFAPLNYRLNDDALRALLARAAPATAVVDDEMLPRVQGVPGLDIVPRSTFALANAQGEDGGPTCACSPSDAAVLLFTSGTTGEPKTAVLRHHHLTAYVTSTVDFLGSDAGEATLVSVPPYHIAGISAALTGVYSGRRLVQLPAFTPEDWVQTARDEKITHAMVVPTMLGRILDLLEKGGKALPDLRLLAYGGGRMPAPVIERVLGRLPHVDFVNAYGLTETSSTVCLLSPQDHRDAIGSTDPAVRRRLASVGRPLPAVELEIRGPGGQRLSAGDVGEVYVRGPQIAGEYLHRTTLSGDGWFPTNDSGWVDEAGYLFLEGRLDDVIVRGGENISPGEIEDVLRGHPAVVDVAVVGAPDEQWGEKIAAFVVCRGPAPDPAALQAWVRSRLRSTKTPEAWVFRDELPYNETGKLLRRVLKQDLADAATSPASAA